MPKVRGHAFGLRGRIVGVVLFTAVATLAVAALALLGPLEQSLRNSEKTTLRKGLGPSHIEHEFGGLRYDQVTTDPAARKDVLKQQSNLEQRLDAHIVQVRHDPGVDGTGSQPVVGQPEDNDSNDDSLNDVAQAFRTGKRVFSFGTIDGLQYARAAIPFNSGAVRY
ncbi:MAG: hypothetical protein WAL63_09320, partial [Solirubrobacteraceae bacterium]